MLPRDARFHGHSFNINNMTKMIKMKISYSLLKLFCLALVSCMVLPTHALAAPLLEKLPSVHLDGIQSDPGTAPWAEAFNIAGPATITKISWWGYYLEGTENEEAGNYQFSVDISGSGPLAGVVNRSFDSIITDISDPQFGLNLYMYELSLANFPFTGGSSTLEISNSSQDVVWLWQGMNSGERAFRVEGALEAQQVSEPGTLVLVGIAMLGLILVSRSKPRLT